MSQTDSTQKHIVVCCDGTWQSSVSGLDKFPSNVTRLARHVACDGKDPEGQEWNQIVYYDSGVGIGEILDIETLIQGGSGRGLTTNVIEAYNFIVLNYKRGDKIYCFGFSRGAYTACAVAGLVTDIGIIKPRDMQEFPDLYKRYQQNKKGDTFRKSQYYHDWIKGVMSKDLDPSTIKDGKMPEDSAGSHAQAQGETSKQDNISWDLRPHDMPEPETQIVEVVGVFDTVKSLGIPDIHCLDMSFFQERYAFHNVKLSPFIRNAYHVLAIDEHRGPFTPTLWYIPYKKTTRTFSQTYEKDYDTQYGKAKTKEEKVKAFQTYMKAHEADFLKGIKGKQKLYQVWFLRMHINIDGGSDTIPKDVEQMANITFCWMAELLRPHLTLGMRSTEVFAQEHKDAIDCTCRTKDYGSSWLMSKLNHALEDAKLTNFPYYPIDTYKNVNGWATGTFEDSYSDFMKVAGSKCRHPGQCIEDRSKLPLSQLGWTCEYIHPCVKYRMEKLEHTQNLYHPEGMNNYEQKFAQQGSNTGRFEWAKTGGRWAWDANEKKVVESDVQMPEWVIYPTRGDSNFDDRSFEQAAMKDDVDAQEWIKTLDNFYEGKFSKKSL